MVLSRRQQQILAFKIAKLRENMPPRAVLRKVHKKIRVFPYGPNPRYNFRYSTVRRSLCLKHTNGVTCLCSGLSKNCEDFQLCYTFE